MAIHFHKDLRSSFTFFTGVKKKLSLQKAVCTLRRNKIKTNKPTPKNQPRNLDGKGRFLIYCQCYQILDIDI